MKKGMVEKMGVNENGRNSSKTIWIILAVLIIALIILVGIYFKWFNVKCFYEICEK